MNFFEFFQIVHATHFFLGTYIALKLWLFVPAGLLPILQQSTSVKDAIIAIATSVLSLAWYFVWYGSLQFAFQGRFPLVSPRVFSMLLGFVYSGFMMLVFATSEKPVADVVSESPVYFFEVCFMLLISFLGVLFLTRLQIQFEREKERLELERDRRLDALNPWGAADTPLASKEPDSNPRIAGGKIVDLARDER